MVPEELQLRIYGSDSLPTLIYLPGLHGDWTLVDGFRKHILGKVRFVEFTYPRTLTWSLNDYATNIEATLAKNGITDGCLLGESYGSQILWALVGRKHFQTRKIILAGGFVKHPLRWLVRLAGKCFGQLPFSVLVWSMYAFTKYARFRFRNSNETLSSIDEFAKRRTKLDARAATHRLHLIAGNDPRTIANATQLPVFYLSGFLDPIVPWPFVRNWLKKNCAALNGCKIIYTADHNVLGTAPRESARQVLEWMNH